MTPRASLFPAGLLAVLFLSACGSLLPEGRAPARLFVLEAPRSPQSAAPAMPLPASVQILAPLAAPGLDGSRIALREEFQEMNYFTDARWSGPLADLVQSALVESFEQARRFQAVAGDGAPFRPSHVLTVEIRDFQAEYEGSAAASAASPVAHIRLSARLIDASTQTILATLSCEEREKSTANRMQEVVLALNAAFARGSACLVAGAAAALENAGSASPSPLSTLTPP